MVKSIFLKIIICIVFVSILVTLFCVSSSYAVGDMFKKGKEFLEVEGSNDIDEVINTNELENTSDYIYNVLLSIGIMVAIIVAMILGIQFMVASADEKAKVKEALLPFIVGCIVVFGSFTIWKIVVNMGNEAENSINTSQGSSSGTGGTHTSQGSSSGTGGTHTSSSGRVHGGGGGSF